MHKKTIYPKEWMNLHPYTSVQPSDSYYVSLSNKLSEVCHLPSVPETFCRKACLYVAAYLEDLVSGLGLWKAFTNEQQRLYGSQLPFYLPDGNYLEGEVNLEDICFILWNTCQKALYPHSYIHPFWESIQQTAKAMLPIMEEAYETAPENDLLNDFFKDFRDETEAQKKLNWLFGHTYLTEPSIQEFIDRVTPSDRFIIPIGPHALFLYEWIQRLSLDSEKWKEIKGLFVKEPVIPENQKEKNHELYRKFMAGNGNHDIAYLNGYSELRRFLVEILGWADDDNHTLPQMKEFRNFILMVNEEKGILLAKDVCEFIASPQNPMYQPEAARHGSFRMLTEPTLCPPDLLYRCIKEGWLPDAEIPGIGDKELVAHNTDFIARHALLYYYRGD